MSGCKTERLLITKIQKASDYRFCLECATSIVDIPMQIEEVSTLELGYTRKCIA